MCGRCDAPRRRMWSPYRDKNEGRYATVQSRAGPRSKLSHDPNPRKGVPMNINLSLAPLVSLIAGILILIMPRLLNYIVAFYLIIIGVIGLFGAGNFNFR